MRYRAFAAGVAGFNLAEQIVVVLALYFYLPPEGRGLESQVPTAALWGPVTAFGAAMFFGRLVDSLTAPLIGHLSDRSRSRHGRRRVFLIGSIVPLAALPAVAFFPPAEPGSGANSWFLALVLGGFFAAFAAYVVPLLALLPELAREPGARARLSTWAGASGLVVGLGFPPAAFATLSWAQGALGFEPTAALRAVALASAAFVLALCALPIGRLRAEGDGQPASRLGLAAALAASLRDLAFLIYLAGQGFLVLAAGLVVPLLPYLAVSLLRRSESFVAVLSLPLALGMIAGFLSLPRVLPALGARRSLVAASLLAAPCLVHWALLQPGDLLVGLVSLALVGASIAVFSALPFLLIGQLIDADAARTGTSRAALYFGVQGFALKWVRGLGLAILAWAFGAFGNSVDQPGGIRLAAALAGGCMLLAAACFAVYPEARVLRAAAVVAPGGPSRSAGSRR